MVHFRILRGSHCLPNSPTSVPLGFNFFSKTLVPFSTCLHIVIKPHTLPRHFRSRLPFVLGVLYRFSFSELQKGLFGDVWLFHAFLSFSLSRATLLHCLMSGRSHLTELSGMAILVQPPSCLRWSNILLWSFSKLTRDMRFLSFVSRRLLTEKFLSTSAECGWMHSSSETHLER